MPSLPAPTRPLDLLRIPARHIRASGVRLLHPRLRSWALERLGQLPPHPRVLVLCLGNICRSPYAAEALRIRAKGVVGRVDSAGFIGPGRPSPFEALDEAAARGIDLGPHRSRVVGPGEKDDHDLIVVMEWGQARRIRRMLGVSRDRILLLGDLDPVTPDRRLIPDPFGRGPEAFTAAYERIDRCVAILAERLKGG